VATEAIRGNAETGLRRNCLSVWEVTAQSVANIAPTATPALVVPVIFGYTGNSTWLAYVFSTVALVLVTLNINQFARRSASPGSLYTFVAQGMGPVAGVITGWSLVIAYLIIGGSVVAAFANYISVLASAAGLGQSGFAVALAAIVIGGAGAWYVAYRDIKLSAQLMLVLEFASVGLILVLVAAYFLKSGRVVDPAQLSLSGMNAAGFRQGLVLAVFSYVGFESATALGHEAKDPLRTIPRAVMGTVIAVGLLFIVTSYALVMAFHGQTTPLDQANAPLSILATLAGIPAFGIVIAAGAATSFFACILACINSGSRVLFAMARHGLFHESAGNVHESHATPHIAVSLSSLIVLAVPLAMYLRHTALIDIFGYLGSIGTLAVLFAYVLVSVAAPIYLRMRGELTAGAIAIAAITVLALALPIVASFWPVPAAPYNVLPYVLLGLLLIGAARFIYLAIARPEVIREIQADLLAQNESA
jgi:amino acid transporter